MTQLKNLNITEWPLILAAIGPFRRRSAYVLMLVVMDTALAGLGVGMVFPVFQALLDPAHTSQLLQAAIPALQHLAPDTRLIAVALGTVALFGLKGAVTMMTTVSTNKLLQDLRFYWVNRIGENYLFGPLRLLSGRKPGELLNDWSNETLASTRFFQSCIVHFSSTMLVLALIVMGLVVHWKVTLAMVVVGGAVALLARRSLFGGSARLSQTKVALNQSMTASMIENLTHVRDLKLLQAERIRLNAIDEVGMSLAKAVLRGAVYADIPRVAGEFLAVMAMMLFVVISVKVLNTSPSDMLPMMAFFFIAFYRLISAGSMATAARVKALNELHSVAVVNRLQSSVNVRENTDVGVPLEGLQGDILLRGIHYSYGGAQPTLAGVDATIPLGRMILLVGPSGSGKSTLLDLLLGLQKPDSGSIETTGVNVFSYRLSDWRRQFGYVSQEAALFNGDVRMNLRLAVPDASDEDIEQACRLAGADEFIRDLPRGYATLVGDRGYSLSGGQRKRIAIARALMRRPSVLILDEATTSFEQSLEQSMLATLRHSMPGMTIIQVTHRLTGHDHVDWVVAMQDGRVVAEGQWDQVQSLLAPLYSIQTL
jgi:ABC-type bacteriocin/lantibiotic exporter with double-glycine peptidase domain